MLASSAVDTISTGSSPDHAALNVECDSRGKLSPFLNALRGVVAGLTKRLEWPAPEQHAVAFVRNDVIADRRKGDLSLLGTEHAAGITGQDAFAQGAPPTVRVPLRIGASLSRHQCT